MHYLIRDLNKNEKPREKLATVGAINLTDVELLALVIRSGGNDVSAIDLARSIIEKAGGLYAMQKFDSVWYAQIKYVSSAKASSIVGALELGRRIANKSDVNSQVIGKPENIVNTLKNDLRGKDKEYLFLITLNSRNRLIAKDLLSIGTVNETLLSPREIFKQALLRNASSIIIAHNHPSNDINPSGEDVAVTKKVFDLSSELGIPLLDHVIIGDHNFLSMKAEGLIKSINFDSKGGEKK